MEQVEKLKKKKTQHNTSTFLRKQNDVVIIKSSQEETISDKILHFFGTTIVFVSNQYPILQQLKLNNYTGVNLNGALVEGTYLWWLCYIATCIK